MPQTRGKTSKSKKLSLQSVLRSKDKTDKSSNMDSNTGSNNNGDHAHAPSDNNPEFSQRSINENVTEETRAKSNISPNNLDSHKVISEGENFISSTNPQEDLALTRSLYNQKLLEVQKLGSALFHVERIHNHINVALRALSDKANWPLHLPLITININNSFMEGSPFTPSQYAFGTCVNISGRVMLNEVNDNEPETSVFDTKIFLHTMSKVSKVHRKHEEKKAYYEPGLFECEQVWLKRKSRKKLSSLYQGPYPVHSFSEHSAIIDKNSKLIKVSIRNIKAYFPREDLNKNGEKIGRNKAYDLRERRNKINYAESSSDDEI